MPNETTKQIKLETLHIHNFRNIVDKTYTFTHQHTAIAGLNKLGKTNTLEAYFWLMTDSLISGMSSSKELSTIIPTNDDKAIVLVEATFDISGVQYLFKKEFYNHYVKGTLNGRVTEYTLGPVGAEVKYKTQKAAYEEIEKTFGFNALDTRLVTPTLKNNLSKFLTNPKWIVEVFDSIELRKLIMTLCGGDISNDELLKLEPNLIQIINLYDLNGKDTNRLKTSLKNKKDDLNKSIDYVKGALKGFNEIKDVDASELTSAKATIEQCKQSIYDLQNKKDVEDPRITLLEKSRQELSLELSQESTSSHEQYNKSNQELQNSINDIAEKKNKAINDLERLNSNYCDANNDRTNNNSDIANLKYKIEIKTFDKEELQKKYFEEKHKEFVFTGTTITCPECGKAFDYQIDTMREAFEKNKQTTIDNIITKGKNIKNDIENLNLKLSNAQSKCSSLDSVVEVATQQLKDGKKLVNDLTNEYNELVKQIKPYKSSVRCDELSKQINEIDSQIRAVKTQVRSDDTVFQQVASLKSQITTKQQIVDAHIHFEQTQMDIQTKQAELDKLNESLISIETNLTLTNLLIKTKLDLLNEKLKSIIPDVQFTLLEKNLKDDSYTEVCYPMIESSNGQLVKYSSGSTSEKIKCSIKVQQALAKALELSILPVVVDEGETLDIHTKLDESVQMLIALVDSSKNTPTAMDFDNRKVELVEVV